MVVNLQKIEELYSSNLEKYGIDSKSVGWTTEESQMIRFEKLLCVLDRETMAFSVNDLGCGYGELFKYLTRNNYNIKRKLYHASKNIKTSIFI